MLIVEKTLSPEVDLSPDHILRSVFEAALQAVDPMNVVPNFLPSAPKGRTVVVGAGKAAARMAQAVERHWQGPLSGVVVTRYNHGADCRSIKVIEAGHPVPDGAGITATNEILEAVQGLGADDLVICLISGGGSALLTKPAPGISIEEKRDINRALLHCGAPIDEMNCVRRHLSVIKGGGLATACGAAKIVTLIISDVPGDDPSVVASGPTVRDDSTRSDALAILERYKISMPDSVRTHLTSSSKVETRTDSRNEVHVIATAQKALEVAAQKAIELGLNPLVLSDRIEGEARDVGKVHAGIALQILKHDQPIKRPALLLSGGETTVTVRNPKGRGGRNQEFLLSLAVALDGTPGIHALACDTDGIDGSENNAGAIIGPDTMQLARSLGFDPQKSLMLNDAYAVFSETNSLIVTGPTRTNVNDLRAVLIV